MPTERPVAIITGGAAGIGRACGDRFAREGFAVLLADVDAARGAEAERALREAGAEAAFVRCDTGVRADCDAMAHEALDRWGRIDTLVANAGVRVFDSVIEASDEAWQRILSVNLKGVADSCRAVLPAMQRQRRGAIVIVSSVHATQGRATMPLYDATKAGLLSLTRSLAIAHGGDGVRVNAVCPGLTITDFHEARAAERGQSPMQLREANRGYALLGRPAEPDEVAAPIWFLASTDAAMVTGQAIYVDGGTSAGQA